MAQVVEGVPSKTEALSSKPSTTYTHTHTHTHTHKGSSGVRVICALPVMDLALEEAVQDFRGHEHITFPLHLAL
jgi:hypothetical protein